MPNALDPFTPLVSPDHIGSFVNAFRVGQALAPPRRPEHLDAKMNPARRRAEILGAIGAGLATMPYEQRRSVLGHLAPALEHEGVPQGVVNHFDPTDEALAASVDQARRAGRSLSAG